MLPRGDVRDDDDGDPSRSSKPATATGTRERSSDAFRTRYRRWILLAFAVTVVSSTAGLIYGWPALRARLVRDAVASAGAAIAPPLSEEKLGLVFTVGSWSTQGGRFATGLARDRFGTRAVACGCLAALLTGLVGTAFAATATGRSSVPLLAVSLFAIGIGSGGQLCVQPVAGLFPGREGLVLSSLSGAFQISALVFPVLVVGDRPLRRSFAAFGAYVVLLLGLAAVLLPRGDSYLPEADANTATSTEASSPGISRCDDNDNDNDDDKRGSRSEKSDEKGDDEKYIHNDRDNYPRVVEESDGRGAATTERGDAAATVVVVVVDDDEEQRVGGGSGPGIETGAPPPAAAVPNPPPTALEQIRTVEYALLCAWFSIALVPLQYYVAILGYRMEELGDAEGRYADLFAYVFAGAAVTAPLAGYLADEHGLGVAQGLASLTVSLPFALLALGEHLPLRWQVAGLVAYGIGRMSVFGLFFTNCGTRFGYRNYGTLAGLGLLVSALVSLLQYPLLRWTVRGRAAATVNALCAAFLVVPTAPYAAWLHRREVSGTGSSGDDGDDDGKPREPTKHPAATAAVAASVEPSGEDSAEC